jgi:hypothetical protein
MGCNAKSIGLVVAFSLLGAGGLKADGGENEAAPADAQSMVEAYGYEELEGAAGNVTSDVPRLFENVALPEDIGRTAADDLKAEPEDEDMQKLEKKIDLLRGQIQDTKSLILNLGENISKGFVTSTKLLVVHNNLLGSAFEIESIEYKLDGFTVYSNNDPEKIKASEQMVIFDASVLPGNHTLDAIYTLRGTGYGVFTYMEEFKFDMRNQYYFAAPRGKAVELLVEAVDRGTGETLRDRPALHFSVR